MARKRKSYRYFIITDEKHKPMAWDEYSKQLCNCTDETWQDEHHPIRAYTQKQAQRYIRKSTEGKPISVRINYLLMPFNPAYLITKKQLIAIR